jgi:hypothetical protein
MIAAGLPSKRWKARLLRARRSALLSRSTSTAMRDPGRSTLTQRR